MLQVARLAPRLLGDSTELVVSFLRSQRSSGGFVDRAGNPDLYYTVFGIEALAALRVADATEGLLPWLQGFGDGQSLDFVHLCCLARCWANLPGAVCCHAPRLAMLHRLASFRSADGGFGPQPQLERGTVYGCFLALAAYQDLEAELPDPAGVLSCVNGLRADEGGYANQADAPLGLTNSTAAAVTILRHLGQPAPPELGQWLLERCHRDGGFFATPLAPVPDLLSTATALHALASMHVDFSPVREPCLDFVDSLWTARGGFYGTWAEDTLDCEYTSYALLALGHLSVS